MNLKRLTNEQLRSLAGTASQEANTTRQVVHRLRELWDKQVLGIAQKYRQSGSQNKALRLAYVDQEYLRAALSYSDLVESGLRSRIQFETSCMMIKARQSERKYNKKTTAF